MPDSSPKTGNKPSCFAVAWSNERGISAGGRAKRGITCFRLYERDIPELPFVVDRYEDFLHITEYERPHERDLARHASWLELMVQTAATALEMPIQRVFLKSRRKTSSPNSGKSQYTKLNHHGKLREVQEGGLKFLVNLSDYVDTGLFLDHRITRQMVREEAAGKRFLNLFAYTGSFSVYAAAGGADSTTTVDLSRNYLDWAIKNMQANGFAGPNHQYIALDALTFIENEKLRPEKYDLAVVDPPTYSNSKRTDEDWDVQQHHARLLISLADCLTDKATVYFSSNLRTIRLDEAALSSIFSIREITTQTIPEDFRNKRIHRCWKLIKRSQESRVKSHECVRFERTLTPAASSRRFRQRRSGLINWTFPAFPRLSAWATPRALLSW